MQELLQFYITAYNERKDAQQLLEDKLAIERAKVPKYATVQSKVRARIDVAEKAKRRRLLLKKQLEDRMLRKARGELVAEPVQVEQFEWEKMVAMESEEDGGADDEDDYGEFATGRLLREEKKAERLLRDAIGDNGFVFGEGSALRWDFGKKTLTRKDIIGELA